ncbi:MAG: FtsW/RodA/SpoVE family cell cycle protein [Candidatus Marinimicrobia bacterium]|nr:FtsW/RodA/SpoVE family cell cycle protein [Candidatus Neomarinimicrobiota bacterium]
MSYLNIIVKKYDRFLLTSIIILGVFGTVMLFSASSNLSLDETGNRTDTLYLQAHLIRLLVGVSFMFFFMLFDYRKLKDWAYHILGVSIFLLILTKILFIIDGNSSPARWLYLGSISVQTSDLARLSLIIFISAFIHNKREKIKEFYGGYLNVITAIGSIVVLIVIQPDLSTASIILLISFVMLFLGGARLRHMMATAAISISAMSLVILNLEYMRRRIMTFINPESVGIENVYQIKQSLISLANGGFFGLGLGNSLGKNLFLPTPHTDFIFAIIGEETGLIGTIFVLTLFIVIFQRGIQIAKESSEPFGIILALGISFSLILYAFINAAVVTNLVPTTGLAMPLISYGGSSVVVHLASLGILLNISLSKRSISGNPDWRKRIYG